MQPTRDFFHRNAMPICIAFGIAAGLIFSYTATQVGPPETRAPGTQEPHGPYIQRGIGS